MVKEIVTVIAICELKGCKGELELIAKTEYAQYRCQTDFYKCKSCETVFRKDTYGGLAPSTVEYYAPSKLTKEEVIEHTKEAYGFLDENKIIAKRK